MTSFQLTERDKSNWLRVWKTANQLSKNKNESVREVAMVAILFMKDTIPSLTKRRKK